MDDPTTDQTLTARTARWFRPSPAELAGLAILVLGSVVASAVLWFQAAQRPSDLGSGASAAGAAVGPERTTDGPAPGVTGDEPGPGGTAAGPGDHDAGPDGHDAGADAGPDAEVTVHVTGAVTAPGLVVLRGGARVGDAVDAAGGLAAGAQDERINLARHVVDGEHVHVPREGEEPPPTSEPPAGGGSPPGDVSSGVLPDGRVDINRAGQAELETLPGVGPARAEAIVAHRDRHGPFASPGDLRAVSGIGEVTFQRLAELVTVG